MNKTIVFKRNKILNKGGRKFLYSIEDSGLYEIDDKIEQILALSGHTINELFIKLVKEKNMEVEEINNLSINHKVIFDYLFKSSYMPV